MHIARKQCDTANNTGISEARLKFCCLGFFEKQLIKKLSNFSQLFSRCIMSTIKLPLAQLWGKTFGTQRVDSLWFSNQQSQERGQLFISWQVTPGSSIDWGECHKERPASPPASFTTTSRGYLIGCLSVFELLCVFSSAYRALRLCPESFHMICVKTLRFTSCYGPPHVFP